MSSIDPIPRPSYIHPGAGQGPVRPPADPVSQGEDRVTLSREARALSEKDRTLPSDLSEQERRLVETLRKRDDEVRAHEQAHRAAAGRLARGGATFTYQKGPDGRVYAVGGEVSIDTSPVPGDPEATQRKAQAIRAAALAPADPSAQDRAVAAAAGQMEAQARAEEVPQRHSRRRERQDFLRQAVRQLVGDHL